MGVVLWCMGVLVWWSGCAVLAVQFLGPLCGLKSGAAQSCLCCSGRVQKRRSSWSPKCAPMVVQKLGGGRKKTEKCD